MKKNINGKLTNKMKGSKVVDNEKANGKLNNKRKSNNDMGLSKKTKKENSETKTLPKYLIIHPQRGYEFLKKPVNMNKSSFIQENLGTNFVERSFTFKKFSTKYDLYCDEGGMVKELPVNSYVNPIMESDCLTEANDYGGPFGVYVFVAAKNHSSSLLLEIFQKFEKTQQDNKTRFSEKLIKAIENY